jgi:hypothetical protein
MGHFMIDLPKNKKGNVRWGMVNKMQFSLFRKNKSESKRGYIVSLSDSDSKTEYRLFRSPNGEWFKDPEGKEELNDSNLIHIRNAITEKEKELNSL